MLLERTALEQRLAEIVATNMPGHGGDGDPEPDADDVGQPDEDDDKGEERPS